MSLQSCFLNTRDLVCQSPNKFFRDLVYTSSLQNSHLETHKYKVSESKFQRLVLYCNLFTLLVWPNDVVKRQSSHRQDIFGEQKVRGNVNNIQPDSRSGRSI